jgi:2-polyprenyl-3-methyl-5-hydroxy-6-metoxy-1,4-benzoquinol methylase
MILTLLFPAWVALNIPYWKDPRIHNVGNGKLHAAIAPFATKLIDKLSYNGIDIRAKVKAEYIYEGDTVCDFCCGTGFSTQGVGIDTSEPMIHVARETHSKETFVVANAETFGDAGQYDVVTIMFALHEVPQKSRIDILQNALRVCKSRVVVCDISRQKVPSAAMLSGEPYLLEYQKNIKEDLTSVYKNDASVVQFLFDDNYVPNHVMVSVLHKKPGTGAET